MEFPILGPLEVLGAGSCWISAAVASAGCAGGCTSTRAEHGFALQRTDLAW
jgi:hypothetical protein